MQVINRERWHRADLCATLSYYEIDPGKFHGPITKLLRELNSGDTLFFITPDGKLGKGRYAAKVHLVWGELQLYENGRLLPDGTYVPGRKLWFCSGTIKRPRGKIETNANGEKPIDAAIREVRQETRHERKPLRLRRKDLFQLYSGQGQPVPLRESSVWVGIVAWELQYHFLYDCSRLKTRPWPDTKEHVLPDGRVIPCNLALPEPDGTIVFCVWDVRRTYSYGIDGNPPSRYGSRVSSP